LLSVSLRSRTRLVSLSRSRKEHYNEVMALVKEHSGAYGVGVEYAYTMVHKVPSKHPHGNKPGDAGKH
jgi:hypothetical protein